LKTNCIQLKKRCLSKTLCLDPSPLLEITKPPSSQCHKRKTILKSRKEISNSPQTFLSSPLERGIKRGKNHLTALVSEVGQPQKQLLTRRGEKNLNLPSSLFKFSPLNPST